MNRWSPEQVAAAAPSHAAIAAARPLATPASWSRPGCDERAVWGSCRGSGAEPYDTIVDHVGVGYACTCPSRRTPCKHALALLLLWSADQVPQSTAPPPVERWLAARVATRTPADTQIDAATGTTDAATGTGGTAIGSADGPAAHVAEREQGGDERDAHAGDGHDRDGHEVHDGDRTGRDERVERMYAGLDELDRWLDDRMRTGLADPALARYGTWDQLAARLVDARAGSLANRIRRLAGLVGASPDWYSDVLAELGILHLLSQAGRRLGGLPGPLADAVATSVGWQVRQADVLGGVPDTDEWIVAGRSDTREDRIEVRRHWLWGTNSSRWALVLSFAAYRQSLDTSLVVGAAVHADLHRYPGPALRALVGERHGDWTVGSHPPAGDVLAACAGIGAILVGEPWLDRVPFTVRAAVAGTDTGWALTDDTGSLPLLRPSNSTGRSPDRSLAVLLAVSAGEPVELTCEWTPHGVVPLTVHLDSRAIDIGPRADDSFVSVA